MRILILFICLLGACTPYTKAAKTYQTQIETKQALEVDFTGWYSKQANRCLVKASDHGKSDVYKDKPVVDKVKGMRDIYNDCIKKIDEGADEIARLVDEIDKIDHDAAQLILDYARGLKPKAALLALPFRTYPLVSQLAMTIKRTEALVK
jgi:hypothetical protein